MAVSGDGWRIVSGGGDKTLKVWDAESGQETLTLKGYANRVTSESFSPDGHRIVSGSDDKTVKVWDAESGQETVRGHRLHTFEDARPARKVAGVAAESSERNPQSLAVWVLPTTLRAVPVDPRHPRRPTRLLVSFFASQTGENGERRSPPAERSAQPRFLRRHFHPIYPYK